MVWSALAVPDIKVSRTVIVTVLLVTVLLPPTVHEPLVVCNLYNVVDVNTPGA